MKKLCLNLALFVFATAIYSNCMVVKAEAVNQGTDYWLSPEPASEQESYYFSWLGCESCSMLEQQLELKGVEQLPLIARPNWRPAAKIYYALELLEAPAQLLTELQQQLLAKQVDVYSLAEMSEFVISKGVERKALEKVLSSTQLFARVNRAQKIAKQHKVLYVPTILIKGRWLTDARHNKTIKRFIEVTKFLQQK